MRAAGWESGRWPRSTHHNCILKTGQPVKKSNQAVYHGCFMAVSGHMQTRLSRLHYVIFLVSTMAAGRDYFPHPISNCFSRAPIRDSFSLLAELPNWLNENELGYLKCLKDFATQADSD